MQSPRATRLTVLAALGWGFGVAAARGRMGEAGRRQRLIEISDLGGEGRHLFGAGEGPAEAVAGAKQESDKDYPRSLTPPVLTSAKTAALMCSGIWGQAATISARSGLGSMTPRD